MKLKMILAAGCVSLLLIGTSQRSGAQAAPGVFADANHPSGPPDPEKQDEIWQVDPLSGQVSINVPFTTTPQGGRGPKIPFKLTYNSGSTITLQASGSWTAGNLIGSNLQWSSSPLANNNTAPSGPWTTSGPYFYSSSSNIADGGMNPYTGLVSELGCFIGGPYIYADENGASHDTNLAQYQLSSTQHVSNPGINQTCLNASNEASYTWPQASTSDGSAMQTHDGIAIGPDGTTFTGGAPTGSGYLQHLLTDANGNAASIAISGGVATATDALGRTVYVTNVPIGTPGQIPAGSYYTETYDATGTPHTYTITFSTISLPSISMPHPASQSEDCFTGCSGSIGIEQTQKTDSFTAVTEIDLPDQTSYKFDYVDSPYRMISKITFPTGGYVRFSWAIRPYSWTPYGAFTAISDFVVTDVYTSAGGSESHWSYDLLSQDPPTTSPGTPPSNTYSTVYAPDGSYTTYNYNARFTTSMLANQACTMSFSALGSISKRNCKPAYTAQYNATGQLIKTVDQTYNLSALSLLTITSLYDGTTPVQQQVQYAYDGLDNVIEKDESDFFPCSGSPCAIGSPVWLRKTFMTFAYSSNSAMATAHIVDKPSQVLVTDGSGNPASLTNYGYDAHGNLTTVSKCLSISGSGTSATCASSWQTSNFYDATGQLTQAIEGYGTSAAATTTYTWGGQQNGFLLSVQHPNGATDSYTYFTPTGQVATHTDWNNQKTTYDYTDSMHRIHTVTAPSTVDGTTGSTGNAVTTYTYTDSPGAFAVQEHHTVDTAGTTTSATKTYDGLGREVRTVSASPQCASGIEVDTTYDSMSRVQSVSNPFCSTSDPTYGSTQYIYDALGRKTQTTLPDGAVSAIAYAGNATETTDPSNGTVNVQHIQQADGLGRLTDVCEVSSSSLGSGSPTSCGLAIGGTGYLTTYTYDSLGNMITVNQHGLSRSFSYDALSRLTQSMNPEVGLDVYTYPSQSTPCAPSAAVPCTRTDARSVITSYQYDKMSRLTSKSYSTGSDLTSCYIYDTAAGPDSNPKGQLTAEWQQAGSCAGSIPSSAVGVRIRSNHDAMGRVGVDQQCITDASCSATTGNFVYSYNLLGSPVQANNGIYAANVPAGQVASSNTTPMSSPSATWKTTYDMAGHIHQAVVQDQPASGVWPASTFSTAPTLVQPTSYDPFGHMTGALLGIPYGSSSGAVTVARQYDNRSRIVSEVDGGNVTTTSATGSVGAVFVSGTEAGPLTGLATPGTGSILVGGKDGTHSSCGPIGDVVTTSKSMVLSPSSSCTQVPDTGTLTATINGFTASADYASGTTTQTLAQELTASFNQSGSPVTAIQSGTRVLLTSNTRGTAGNYSITVSHGVDFALSATALSGGANGIGGLYDAGTATASITGGSPAVNLTTAAVSWGQGDTPATLASKLASAINNAASSKLTATASGGSVNLVSVGTGTGVNYTVSVALSDTQTASYPTLFPSASFSASNASMTGGAAAASGYGTIYSYQIPSGGYAPNGNILQHSDSVMGTWTYSYDAVDRLVSGAQTASTATSPQYAGMHGCWSYDSYGNRTMEAFSTTACGNNPVPQVVVTYNAANNQISTSTLSSATLTAGSFGYDGSGNTLFDGNNRYWYDAEGQLCAVQSLRYSGSSVIQYVYDAEGARIGQGTLASAPSSYTSTCAPPFSAGFTLTKRYLVDLGGDQVTELDGAGVWKHSNIWAGGKLVATYDTKGIHFELTDPLGTKRVQANALGQIDEQCTGLPFGNDLANNPIVSCSSTTNSLGTNDDATEHHFTGKERDSESGNDYFGARYYASSMGRWMSPDDSLDGAIMELPQTWNKYSYEYNRPLYGTDPDGRCPPCIGAIIGGVVEGGFDLGKQLYNNGGNVSQVSWGEVGANAAGGAVAGAIAGATGGASLIIDAAAGATGNIVGGVVTRGLDPNTSSDDVLSAGAVSQDALSGFVGGGAGHVAGEFVHVPEEPSFRFNGRNGRVNNQAYRNGLKALAGRNTQTFVNQGVRAGVTSSATTHTTNGLQDWFTRWFFNQSPQPEPQPHVTHRICDENGNNCQ